MPRSVMQSDVDALAARTGCSYAEASRQLAGGVKYRLAFASNSITSPAYPSAHPAYAFAPPPNSSRDNLDYMWGRSNLEKQFCARYPKGAPAPAVAHRQQDAFDAVTRDRTAERHFSNTLAFAPERVLLDAAAERRMYHGESCAAGILEQRARSCGVQS